MSLRMVFQWYSLITYINKASPSKTLWFPQVLGYPGIPSASLDPVGCQNTTDVEMGQGEVFWALQHQIEPLARLWPGCSWETWHFMFFGPWDVSWEWYIPSKWTWLDVAGKPHSPWSLCSHLISEKIESMGIFHCHGRLPEGTWKYFMGHWHWMQSGLGSLRWD